MLKGNDYLLIWLLTEPDGTPIDYNQFDSYKVFIQNDSNKSYKYEVVTDALDDGLHFDFKSDMQKSTGYYSLIFEAVKDGRNYKAECYRGVHIDGNVDKAQCVVGAPNSIIKLTDCLSLYLGGRDGRSPYVGVNNHWWVFNDLSKMYADTGIKVDYSAEIGAQITLAEQAITRVNQTNQTVSENEIARSQNEAIREQEERTRVANEVERVYDEKVRVANEAKRAEDEAERLSNETSRKDSEAARVNNEAARVSGEDVRVRNEASRTSEESTRVSNENARKSNETTRVNAESSRVSAEQSRVTEEGKRAAAETKRQTDTAKAIQDTNTAAQNATDVAAGMEGKIVQLQQDVNTRFTEDEGHIKRESVHPLQGKATGVTNISARCEIGFLKQWTANILVSGKSLAPNAYYILNLGTRPNVNIAVQKDGYHYAQMYDGSIYHSWTHTKYSGNILITITYDGNTCKCYYNGEYQGKDYIGELNFNKLIFINNSSVNESNMNIGITNIFNYALSPEEVKELYNNGRPDKVVLGNDKKNIVSKLLPHTNATNVAVSTKTIIDNIECTKITSTGTGMGYTGVSYDSILDSNLKHGNKVRISLKLYQSGVNSFDKGMNGFNMFGLWCTQNPTVTSTNYNPDLINQWQDVYFEGYIKTDSYVLSNKVFLLWMNINDYSNWYAFSDLKIEKLGCASEYLPSSLTPTAWRDTSGNGNHLVATGTPELIYTPIFVDHIVKDVPPNIIPNFVGQKYTDKTAKVIYESVGMTAVSDWVQISK